MNFVDEHFLIIVVVAVGSSTAHPDAVVAPLVASLGATQSIVETELTALIPDLMSLPSCRCCCCSKAAVAPLGTSLGVIGACCLLVVVVVIVELSGCL